ncbi:transmembrane protein 168-like [Anneissia japonica]|uniref:transmembrane protein 168-like n=1 Tax=Anneissia japonica TaxID=1529436 RepID=UPI00142574A2|nr:transmembrane protein 168-like [Anneissia japonica]XP_033098738.1 transmembrane protein 168-like [Anneissia japonica]
MHSLRYVTSHLLVIPVEGINKMKSKLKCNIHLLGVIDIAVLLLAVCAGLYSSWYHTNSIIIIVIIIFGLLIFSLCSIFYYYFNLKDISESFSHLWFGCLLGMIAFFNHSSFDEDRPTMVTNILLISSLGIKIIWSFVQRASGNALYKSRLLTQAEKFEFLGFGIACVLGTDYMTSMWLLVIANMLMLIMLRLKVSFSLPCIIIFYTISVLFFFKAMADKLSHWALLCFTGRLLCDPFFDLYYNGLSMLERWHCFISLPRYMHRFIIICITVIEIYFFQTAGYVMISNDEWYLSVPLFFLFGVVWICLHVIFVLTSWTFANKLSECNSILKTNQETNANLSTVMASKGLRYFALISKYMILSVLLSTVLLGATSWQATNTHFMASILIVLPMEVMFHGILQELGGLLGGTCCCYAVIGPSGLCRSDRTPVLLPTNAIEEQSRRSVNILNSIQRFLVHHMIDIFSCDFSSGGIAMESLETKMRSFLSRRTSDGPRFDTYLVYYSGDVYQSGDWALADNGVLKFETLLTWWHEVDADSGARLIIILDTKHHSGWLKQIKRNSTDFIAIQTCSIGQSDPETGIAVNTGDFTMEWVAFNVTRDADITWAEQGRKTKAVYGVSKNWVDFTFHKPTEDDIEVYWTQNFPRITHSLIKVLQVVSSIECDSCCWCLDCCRKIKMKWLPPKIINTGHGFKLVRS